MGDQSPDKGDPPIGRLRQRGDPKQDRDLIRGEVITLDQVLTGSDQRLLEALAPVLPPEFGDPDVQSRVLEVVPHPDIEELPESLQIRVVFQLGAEPPYQDFSELVGRHLSLLDHALRVVVPAEALRIRGD